MIQDLDALEDLRHSLDPENKNVLISSEHFFDVIGRWSQKIVAGTSEDEFQSSCHLPTIEDKDLPYSHSTPRASLGDKLLKCKDLLNLSNISGYSLSTSRLDITNHNDVEKLEEEIKKLEHQILKLTSELSNTKQQLSSSEEQNDILQQSVDRLNKRLYAEQQVVQHLQTDRKYHEEFREEIQFLKDTVEVLKKQLSQSERDNLYYKKQADELEQERIAIERKNEVLAKQHQECLKEILDMKTEIEAKEQQIDTHQKDYDELKAKFNEQRDIIDQLRQEIDTANYAKLMLKKSIKSKLSMTRSRSGVGNSDIFIKTPCPSCIQEDFHLPPSFDNYNGAHCRTSTPVRKMVLLRKTGTLSDYPKISPINTPTVVQNDQPDGEEDWKSTAIGSRCDMESAENTESLQLEIHKADPLLISKSYDTLMFERDEHIVSLEDELEGLKYAVDATESEKENLTRQLDQLRQSNQELLSRNLALTNQVEAGRAKRRTLKQRLTQLEQNAVIMEHPREEEIDTGGRFSELEEALKQKELIIEELTVKLENNSSLAEEVNRLRRDRDTNEKLQFNRRKESELVEINEKLEGDARNSVGAEEKTLTLGLKCNQQQQELNDLSIQLNVTRESVCEAQDRIETLNDENAGLLSSIESLRGTISDLEDAPNVAKIQNINGVIKEIQKHLDTKSDVIKELRELNRTLETSLKQAESSSKEKMEEILNLRVGLKNDISVKNSLWGQMDVLRNKLGTAKASNEELRAVNDTLTKSADMQQIEYNNLLIFYDLEVKKNLELREQIDRVTKELNHISADREINLTRETETNRHFQATISRLEKQLQDLTRVERRDFSSQTDALDETNREANGILRELENELLTEINKNNETSRTLQETRDLLRDRNQELSRLKQKLTDTELTMTTSIDHHIKKSSTLSKDLAKAQEFIMHNQIEISRLNEKLAEEQTKTESLSNELRTKSTELETVKKQVSLSDMETKENTQKLLNKLAEANLLLSNKQKDIDEIQIGHIQALEELDNEKRMLRTQLVHLNDDLLEKKEENANLEENLLVLEQEKSQLLIYKDTSQKLQDQAETNRIMFENARLITKERDNLSSELREAQTVNSNLQVVLSAKQLECQDWQAKCLVLEEKNRQQADVIQQSELLLKQNQEELKKACFQKDLLNNELTRINSLSSINNSEEAKGELQHQAEGNRRWSSDFDEKRRGRTSSDSRESGKGKSYFRQQLTIDRLRQKVERLENELKSEKSANEDLRSKLSLTESQRLSWEVSGQTKREAASNQRNFSSSFDSSPFITEGKPKNKFTLRSPKAHSTISADSSSTNYEAVIEVPPLNSIGIATILQDLDLSDTSSSGAKINREETEKRVLNLISILRTNSSDVYERIERHTEKYNVQYEGILTLLRDVSYRLRDHVCIGTAEPIMPVFVLLEEIKIQLKQLVENVGQVGALIYENKMRNFWSLLTDYVVYVQQESELSSRAQKSTSPTQSGLKKRKSKTAPDKGHTESGSSQKKKRGWPKIRLTMLFLIVTGLSLIVGVIFQLNCRMTVADSQFCPLDSIITRINDGLPPM